MKCAYKHRWIAEKMRQAIEFSPVIGLSDARQTVVAGETILIRPHYQFAVQKPVKTAPEVVIKVVIEHCGSSSHMSNRVAGLQK